MTKLFFLFLFFFIAVLLYSADSHSGCISHTGEKEIFQLSDEYTESFERDPNQTIPTHVFDVTFDPSVPPDVSKGILNVVRILEGVINSQAELVFKVNMSSGNNQWGSSSSSLWSGGYREFLTEIPENLTEIFPGLETLDTNINWPLGFGWTSGRILLTNWQAYARGSLSKNDSRFTLWIDEDFMDRFDFNSTDGTDNDKFDFETLILHQLIHELGFHSVIDFLEFNATNPEDKDFWIFPFDVFRFGYMSPSSAQSVLSDTRQFDPSIPPHTFWDGSLTSPVPLERGTNFTGYNASHWLHQETLLFGVMDPNIPKGMAVGLSANDIASFRTMGWNIQDTIVPQITAATINGSFVVVHGNLFVGPEIKCRFNQQSVVDPGDVAANNAYKWVSCPIPPAYNGQNATLWLEVSNDGGKTWSFSTKAVNPSQDSGNDNDSPASQLGRLCWLNVLFSICIIFLLGRSDLI